MAIKGVDFKWYDGFFLSMLATSMYPLGAILELIPSFFNRIVVAINWGRYHVCEYPLHIWIVAGYTAVFSFRLLMFVDNGLASGMGLDLGSEQRYARFCGRTVVLSILAFLLYPFLWAWTIIGSHWFVSARDCLPEDGQKWGFLIWLLFSYCGLACIATICVGKVGHPSFCLMASLSSACLSLISESSFPCTLRCCSLEDNIPAGSPLGET